MYSFFCLGLSLFFIYHRNIVKNESIGEKKERIQLICLIKEKEKEDLFLSWLMFFFNYFFLNRNLWKKRKYLSKTK